MSSQENEHPEIANFHRQCRSNFKFFVGTMGMEHEDQVSAARCLFEIGNNKAVRIAVVGPHYEMAKAVSTLVRSVLERDDGAVPKMPEHMKYRKMKYGSIFPGIEVDEQTSQVHSGILRVKNAMHLTTPTLLPMTPGERTAGRIFDVIVIDHASMTMCRGRAGAWFDDCLLPTLTPPAAREQVFFL